MANVDTDHHGGILVHEVRQLDSDVLSASLLVDLLHDIRGNRKVELPTVPPLDHLRDDLHLGKDLFGLVVILLIVDDEEDSQVFESIVNAVSIHVVHEGILDVGLEELSIAVVRSITRILESNRID